jgi:hypothetical protein
VQPVRHVQPRLGLRRKHRLAELDNWHTPARAYTAAVPRFSERIGYFGASADVVISHVTGNQQFDATVDDRRAHPGAVKFIEATVSDWSSIESLRMELLTRDGHTPGYGAVQAKGARGAARN